MYIVSDAVLVSKDSDDAAKAMVALPQAVKDAINTAGPHPGEIYNIGPGEVFTESVLWYERIQFADKASLTLNPGLPFVAIVADELLFTGPPYHSVRVSFDEIAATVGEVGPTGAQGAPGNRGHAGHHHGYPGGRGHMGGIGSDGGTVSLPAVYILANAVQAQDAPDQAALFHFEFEGVQGGQGGYGGQGGKGGPGGRGAQAISGLGGCQRGGGKGGDGGPGGYSGKPGDGGNAGDGVNLALIVTTAAIDVLKFSEVFNLPGAPGAGGFAGRAGLGGDGGQGGKGKGHCNGGERGKLGKSPIPSPNGGLRGAEGDKGTNTVNEVADYRDELA